MAEPTTTAGAALAVGSVSVAGTLLGIPYEGLILGLFAGLLSLKREEDLSRFAAVSKVTVSALFGGAGAPVATESVRIAFGMHSPVIEPLCALAIGYGWRPLLSGGWDFVRAKWGGQNA